MAEEIINLHTQGGDIDKKEIKKESPLKATSVIKKIENKGVLLLSLTAIFPVIFMWGVFDRGIGAFGYNMTVFGGIIFGVYFYGVKQWQDFLLKNIAWILPVALIFMSFSFFGNIFIKSVNVLLLPFLLIFFCKLGKMKNTETALWTGRFIKKVFFKKTATFSHSIATVKHYMNSGGQPGMIVKKLAIGLGILGGLNFLLISLLSSADKSFGSFIGDIGEGFTVSIIFKIIVAILIFIYALRLKIGDTGEHIISGKEKGVQRDSLIAGVVIGGTLVTYLCFLMLQLDSLVSGNIPLGVEKAAQFAKSGFWQLFQVSVINIVLFFVYFKKTHSYVQALLFGFIIASIAILLSAGMRMYLYVGDYGLSYEKFYASYTVIFFGVLFLVMLAMLFSKKYTDILKVSVYLGLWMYALITLFPTDSTIFRFNTRIALANTEFSGKYQSHMLSTDIVRNLLQLKSENPDLFENQSWQRWLYKKEKKAEKQKWYEKNIGSL